MKLLLFLLFCGGNLIAAIPENQASRPENASALVQAFVPSSEEYEVDRALACIERKNKARLSGEIGNFVDGFKTIKKTMVPALFFIGLGRCVHAIETFNGFYEDYQKTNLETEEFKEALTILDKSVKAIVALRKGPLLEKSKNSSFTPAYADDDFDFEEVQLPQKAAKSAAYQTTLRAWINWGLQPIIYLRNYIRRLFYGLFPAP